MAFRKTADAQIVQPVTTIGGWNGTPSRRRVAASTNLIDQASEIFGKPFNPEEYLLTHCTIVASVDTEEPVKETHRKLGRVQSEGRTINRKYSNYRVNPECDKLINNNHDAWGRDVLLKSYRSFIGAQNFVEHVQIAELSKGRIIDAVARDVGKSVYVDILVATSREHDDLVRKIESGDMSTLSMGCTVDETQCTRCGNVAHDETDMCDHVKYMKGNYFYDEAGARHRVAELCGHASIDPDGGVQFIEGSWVGTPAFSGAVLRNILTADNVDPAILKKAEAILRSPPAQWSKKDPTRIATRTGMVVTEDRRFPYQFSNPTHTRVLAFGFDDGEEGEEQESKPKDKANPMDGLTDEVKKFVLDRARKEIKKDLSEEEKKDLLGPEETATAPNDSLVKQAKLRRIAYQVGISSIRGTTSSEKESFIRLIALNRAFDLKVPDYVYQAASKVGSASRYPDLASFLRSCRRALGRVPTQPEARTLIRISKVLGTTN